jgi:hypothetical protein
MQVGHFYSGEARTALVVLAGGAASRVGESISLVCLAGATGNAPLGS